jgi:hypothetical protein
MLMRSSRSAGAAASTLALGSFTRIAATAAVGGGEDRKLFDQFC